MHNIASIGKNRMVFNYFGYHAYTTFDVVLYADNQIHEKPFIFLPVLSMLCMPTIYSEHF